MRRIKPALISACLIIGALLGCSSPPPKPVLYKMLGTVVSVDPPSHQATITNEAIPGFMEAMTMPYVVKDDAGLKKLAPGDHIAADLMVNKETGEAWLTNIQVTRAPRNK